MLRLYWDAWSAKRQKVPKTCFHGGLLEYSVKYFFIVSLERYSAEKVARNGNCLFWTLGVMLKGVLKTTCTTSLQSLLRLLGYS